MKNVTIYSTPICTYCKKAKEFLDDNGVSYAEINAALEPGAKEKILEMTGRLVVPVFNIDGKWISGFDELVLAKELQL